MKAVKKEGTLDIRRTKESVQEPEKRTWKMRTCIVHIFHDLEHASKWYEHSPQKMSQNETVEILWDMKIQTAALDHGGSRAAVK